MALCLCCAGADIDWAAILPLAFLTSNGYLAKHFFYFSNTPLLLFFYPYFSPRQLITILGPMPVGLEDVKIKSAQSPGELFALKKFPSTLV